MRTRATALRRSRSSKISTLPRPGLLGAVGGGVGVGDERPPASVSAPLPSAIPTLAEIRCWVPSTSSGSCTAAATRQPSAERDALVDVLADDDELVAAEPRDGVRRAHRGGEPARERDQHGVAGRVPVEVVDALEVVDVDVEHGGAGARALGVGERVLEPVAAERAVGEPGQRVVQRLVADPLLGAHARVGGGEHVGDRDEERALLLGRRTRRRP